MPSRWIATATGDRRTTDYSNPQAAALAFFNDYPTARKCDVREWRTHDGPGLIRRYGPGESPFRDFAAVTAKAAGALPAEA